jgi:cytochrome c oxidase assembly protein subunit 15
MVTGFMILGSVALAWRQGRDRRGAWYLSGALVLLPLQIALGALTVTLNGLLPWGYSVPVHAAHFSTGLTIFTLLGLTTARAWRGALAPRLRALAVAALALVPVQYLFSFGTVLPYSAEVQGAYYGLSLGIFTLVLAGAVGAASAGDRRLRSLFSGGAVLMAVEMVLGRQYLAAFPQVANDLLSVATLAVLAVTVWAASQRADEPAASPYPQTDD